MRDRSTPVSVSEYLQLSPKDLAGGGADESDLWDSGHILTIRLETAADLSALRVLPRSITLDAIRTAIALDDALALTLARSHPGACTCAHDQSPDRPRPRGSRRHWQSYGQLRPQMNDNLSALLTEGGLRGERPFVNAYAGRVRRWVMRVDAGHSQLVALAARDIEVPESHTLHIPDSVDMLHARTIAIHSAGKLRIDGGSLTIVCRRLRGYGAVSLDQAGNIDLSGLKGEDGGAGERGSRGQTGARGADAYCGDFDDECATTGGKGGPATDGGEGGHGGPGGAAGELLVQVRRLDPGIIVDATGGPGGLGGHGGEGGKGGTGGSGGSGLKCEHGRNGGSGGKGGAGGPGGRGGMGGRGGRIVIEARIATSNSQPIIRVTGGVAGTGGAGGIGGAGGATGARGKSCRTCAFDCDDHGAEPHAGPPGARGVSGEPGQSGDGGSADIIIGTAIADDGSTDEKGATISTIIDF